MKRSQSDVSISKSQENLENSILVDGLNNLEVFEDDKTTNNNSTNNNIKTTVPLIPPPHILPPTTIPHFNLQPIYNVPISPLIVSTSSATTTPNIPTPSDRKFLSSSSNSSSNSSTSSTPTLVSEKAKPKKTLSVTNFDLQAGELVPSSSSSSSKGNKKYATISNGNNHDLSPKKSTKMKSVSNFFKKSTSHNNLLDVNDPNNNSGGSGSGSSGGCESPSLNSSSSSIGSTNSSNVGNGTLRGNKKDGESSLKSKIDSFFSSGSTKVSGNRSSLKYENVNSVIGSGNGSSGNLLDISSSEDSDFDSEDDEDDDDNNTNNNGGSANSSTNTSRSNSLNSTTASKQQQQLQQNATVGKRGKLKLFVNTGNNHQRSKSKEDENQPIPQIVGLEMLSSQSVPCTPKTHVPSPICNSNSVNSSIEQQQQQQLNQQLLGGKKLEKKSISDPNMLALISEVVNESSIDGDTNDKQPSQQQDENEENEEERDLKKSLERRLIRRPTVAELKLDNIIFQTEFEDVAKEQIKIEINSQKLFVGTRPSKKKFFNSPITNVNSINVSLLKIENNFNQQQLQQQQSDLSKNLMGNQDESPTAPEGVQNCKLLIATCSGWKREAEMEDYLNNPTNQQNATNSLCIEEIENEFSHYHESFMKDRHKNYLANNQEDLGPVVISIKREAERTPSYRKLKKKKKEKESFLTPTTTATNNGNEVSASCPNLSVHINQQSSNLPQSSPSLSLQILPNPVLSISTSQTPLATPTSSSAPVQPFTNMESMERKFKTIIRTKDGEDRFYLSSGKSSPHELINTIKSFFLSDYPELHFQKIPNNSETRKMLQYWETAQMTKDYKFGILYRKNGQTNENDLFSNKEESPEFKEFLEFIGEKVKLKGFDRFKGGLDIKNDTTGTHSVFNTKEVSINESKKFNVSIMFHVSTYLPYYANDPQQLERKRHIGNDIVVIIFQDTNCFPPFKPNMIKSEFNHVFVVIQPIEKSNPNEQTKYSVSISYKDGVSTSTPYFSSQKIWKKDSVFLDHLLTKLVNAEKASYYSPSFSDKMKRTRLVLLKNIVTTTLK